MWPASTRGRVIYALVASICLLTLLQGVGLLAKFFWPFLGLLVLVVNGIQFYLVGSKPLLAYPESPQNLGEFAAWAVTVEGRAKLLRVALALGAYAVWLILIVWAAAHMRKIGQ